MINLTKEERLFNIQILYTRAYLYFDTFTDVGAALFYLVGAIAEGTSFELTKEDPIYDFLQAEFVSDHPIMQHCTLLEE